MDGKDIELDETEVKVFDALSEQKFEPPSGGSFPAPGANNGYGQRRVQYEDIPEDITGSLVVPKELIAHFITEDTGEVNQKFGDNFNSLNQELIRETTPLIKTRKELIEEINRYEQEGDQFALAGGYMCCCITASLYYWCNRKIVPDGYYGHYKSSGRDMIKKPGIHVLWSLREDWVREIEIHSDQTMVDLNSKILLTVPENHLGGATRRTGEPEFVIFKEGRYVLDNQDYEAPFVVNLNREHCSGQDRFIIKLGPIFIVYIKEGYIGGANRIHDGKYILLHPGPPYLLGEKAYEKIEVVERKDDYFNVGPYQFITVREGMLAGAYHKKSGKYQILVPGETYQLYEAHYKIDNPPNLVPRKENFRDPNNPGFTLGPYTFITVKKGYVAGVWKKSTGDFIILPPGKTYQLNDENFRDPVMVKRDRHIIQCGPKTMVTVQRGKLVGAWRIADGKFIEFDNPQIQYELHEKNYHDIQCIDKYSYVEQEFGTWKIITIQEGFVGVFEREGKKEIKPPGFYKLEVEYRILPSIPVKIHTMTVPRSPREPCDFRTKDSAEMRIVATLIWQVTEPKKTALQKQGFEELCSDIYERFQRNLVKYCMRFNRDELLPTSQDIIRKSSKKVFGEEVDRLLEASLNDTQEKLTQIQNDTHNAMVEAAKASNWGIEMRKTILEEIQLTDQRLIKTQDEISQSLITTSLVNYKGDLRNVKQDTERNIKLKRVATRTEIEKKKANSDVEIRKEQALGEQEVKKIRTTSLAKIDVIRQKARSAQEVLKSTTNAEANAKTRQIKLQIKNREIKETAKVEAKAITLMANAEYEKNTKANEAIAKMTDKQFKLQMADKNSSAMCEMGSASWNMPDQILQFYESFGPYLRMGNASAAEVLQKVTSGK